MNLAIEHGQETWTAYQENFLDKTLSLLKNLGITDHTESISNLYGIKKIYGDFEIPVPDDCPDVAYKHIQKHLNKSVPLLSREHPDMPCLIHTLKHKPDGYAHHTPPKSAQGSVILSRYIYQYLFYPKGIPTHNSDGQVLEVDHTCGNGHLGCINPLHLNLTTKKLNRDLGNRRNL
jgi:hypothetical protein